MKKIVIVLLTVGIALISFHQISTTTNAAIAPMTQYLSNNKMTNELSTSSDSTSPLSFKNVDIRISGLCRTLIYSRGYLGGRRSGHLPHVGACVINAYGDERISVVIKDASGKTLFSKSSITSGIVFMTNADGNFYWSAYGNGYSRLPPLIYINCHAEEVYVTIGSYGNNAPLHQQVLQSIH